LSPFFTRFKSSLRKTQSRTLSQATTCSTRSSSAWPRKCQMSRHFTALLNISAMPHFSVTLLSTHVLILRCNLVGEFATPSLFLPVLHFYSVHLPSEMEMGRWVMGHGSNGSLFLDGSRGSWVTASDPRPTVMK